MFKHLPDKLFAPLAGPDRNIRVSVLTRLHVLFFGASAALLSAYETVCSEIEEVLAGLGVLTDGRRGKALVYTVPDDLHGKLTNLGKQGT